MAGTFIIAKARNGKFKFNLLARNKEVILSSELYGVKASATTGIASVQKNAPDDKRFVTKTAKNGSSYFVLMATNGRVIGTSEMYKTAAALKKGIASVRANAAGAKIVDTTT